MCRSYFWYIIFIGCSVSILSADEHNICFLPGDSYFRATLTRDIVTAMQRDDGDSDITLDYPHLGPNSMVGYPKLRIAKFSNRRRRLAAAVYEHVREQQPGVFAITPMGQGESRKELNGVGIFVYNRSFDYTQYCVGLRYNEDWPEEGRPFGAFPSFIEYYANKEPVPGYVVEDWRNSKRFPPLKAQLPTAPGKVPHELQFTPVAVKNEDVVIVLVPDGMLEELRMGEGDWGYFIVEDEQMRRVRRDPDSGWMSELVLLKEAKGSGLNITGFKKDDEERQPRSVRGDKVRQRKPEDYSE